MNRRTKPIRLMVPLATTLAAVVVIVMSAGLVASPPTGSGNNLSYPVIWAEGVTKDLRGEVGTVVTDGEWHYWWGTDENGDPLTCRPDPDAAQGEVCCDDGLPGSVGPPPGPGDVVYKAYVQKDAFNEWQADSVDGSIAPVKASWIDWGDNLESQPWNLNSMVRTEVVLYKDLYEVDCAADCANDDGVVDVQDLVFVITNFGTPIADVTGDGITDVQDLVLVITSWGDCPVVSQEMLEYQMRHVSGWGIDEVWGLSTLDDMPEIATYDFVTTFPQATVYSPCARLTIQKLLVPRDDARLEDLIWTPGDGWSAPPAGDDLVNPALYNMAVWEAGDGPGYYNAEINVKGKIIFGYTWNVRNLNEGASDYRITFSLDESCGTDVTLNTFFDEAAIVEPVDGEDGSGEGGTAVLDVENNLTFIDVRILPKGGGGGGGGGGR